MALGIALERISVGLQRRGGKISVGFPFYVLLYNTNLMNKLKFNDFLQIKTKKKVLTNVLYSTKSSHCPLRGKVGQLKKRN